MVQSMVYTVYIGSIAFTFFEKGKAEKALP